MASHTNVTLKKELPLAYRCTNCGSYNLALCTVTGEGSANTGFSSKKAAERAKGYASENLESECRATVSSVNVDRDFKRLNSYSRCAGCNQVQIWSSDAKLYKRLGLLIYIACMLVLPLVMMILENDFSIGGFLVGAFLGFFAACLVAAIAIPVTNKIMADKAAKKMASVDRYCWPLIIAPEFSDVDERDPRVMFYRSVLRSAGINNPASTKLNSQPSNPNANGYNPPVYNNQQNSANVYNPPANNAQQRGVYANRPAATMNNQYYSSQPVNRYAPEIEDEEATVVEDSYAPQRFDRDAEIKKYRAMLEAGYISPDEYNRRVRQLNGYNR